MNLSYLNYLQDFNAKLSDFGLARNGPTGDKSHVSTRVVGTHGYAAPEYIATGKASSKTIMCFSLLNMLTLHCYQIKQNSETRFSGHRCIQFWTCISNMCVAKPRVLLRSITY